MKKIIDIIHEFYYDCLQILKTAGSIFMKRLFLKFFILLAVIPALQGSLFSQDADNTADSMLQDIFTFVPPEKKAPDEKKWFFSSGGMYNNKTGNTETFTSNYNLSLKYDDSISAFVLSFGGFYGEDHRDVYENKGKGIIKFDHYIIPRVELFIFSQSEYNKPALLYHRNNSGAGAKLLLFHNSLWKTDISAAPVYQYEKYETENATHNPRWSLRYRILITPAEAVQLSMTIFYIPYWNNTADYRRDFDGFVSVDIAPKLQFKAGYINEYNNKAPRGNRKTDTTTYVQIALKL